MESDSQVRDQEARPLDLSLLWEVIDKHKQEQEGEVKQVNSTWELVLIQAVLLTLLIMVAIIWAVCCKNNCCRSRTDQLSVAEALRKVSNGKLKDLPPSYSKVGNIAPLHTHCWIYLYRRNNPIRLTCAVWVSPSMITSTLPPRTWTSSRTACSTWTWSRATTDWPSSVSVTRTGRLGGWRG